MRTIGETVYRQWLMSGLSLKAYANQFHFEEYELVSLIQHYQNKNGPLAIRNLWGQKVVVKV